MKCLYCESETKVLDSRESLGNKRRRRECLNCHRRFTTYERVEIPAITVIKKDGREEFFSRSKILKGIIKACRDRPISPAKLEKITDDIERKIRGLNISKIESKTIGNFVMDELKELDKLAYVRFASVYQDFEDLVTVKE